MRNIVSSRFLAISVAEVSAEAGTTAAKNQTASKARINGRRIIERFSLAAWPLPCFPAVSFYD
ncbi:MAG: hypothetical protein WBE83_04235 [Candidatus Cybelea sp.]|jgi:hypothetical protein